MPDDIYPDITDSKFDIKYAQLKVLASDINNSVPAAFNGTSGDLGDDGSTLPSTGGTATDVIMIDSTFIDLSAVDFDNTFTTLTIFLKASTDSAGVVIPNAKAFAANTSNTPNTIYFIRCLQATDPFTAAIAAVEGNIEEAFALSLAEGDMYAIQSNGEEYKIIAKWITASASPTYNRSYTAPCIASSAGTNVYIFLGPLETTNTITYFVDSVLGNVEVEVPEAVLFDHTNNSIDLAGIVIIIGIGGAFSKQFSVHGGGTINGSSSPITLANGESYWLQSNGEEYKIINHNT